MLTKSNRRSFDSAGAKGRTCYAQDDSSFIFQTFTHRLYVDTALHNPRGAPGPWGGDLDFEDLGHHELKPANLPTR